MLKMVCRTISVLLLVFSTILLAWGSAPTKQVIDEQLIEPASMQINSKARGESYAVLEKRLIRVKHPRTMRIGDNFRIVLDFIKVPDGTAEFNAASSLMDVYKDYNLVVEGRFEVVGVRVLPTNSIGESMPPGQGVSFRWDINAAREGEYDGALWVSLRFIPLDGADSMTIPIYVREVNLTARNFLGMSGPTSRLAGGVGIITVLILVFGDMIKTTKGVIGKIKGREELAEESQKT